MKLLRPFLCLSALALSACDKPQAQQPAAPDEQEVERRVQARLAAERQADLEKAAREREQALNERERQLNERQNAVQAAQPATPQAPANVVTAQSPDSSYQLFYDNLTPYGAWIELDNQGYVWQPRVTLQNPRWRPYTVGRWAYTDYGWTWLSNEPWGWATYHYGRWSHLRRLGWVWQPDDDWGPAWVSWRYSDRYVGWAPLPPAARFDGASGIREWADEQYGIASDDYVFVPGSEFGDDEMAAVVVPPEQNVTIVSETVNVTNIIVNNAIIVNHGPNFLIVNKRVRKPIAQLKVERHGAEPGGQNAARVSGQTVQMAAPKFKKDRGGAASKPTQILQRTADVKMNDQPIAPPPASAATAAAPQLQPATPDPVAPDGRALSARQRRAQDMQQQQTQSTPPAPSEPPQIQRQPEAPQPPQENVRRRNQGAAPPPAQTGQPAGAAARAVRRAQADAEADRPERPPQKQVPQPAARQPAEAAASAAASPGVGRRAR